MMNQNELVVKAMAMVQEGKTMEEALQFILSEAVKATAPVKEEGPRVDRMKAMKDIQELRKAIKSSNGMKSKMKKNAIAVERYTEEIKTGKQRIKDIMAEINKAEDPYSKAREFNADADDILVIWLSRNGDRLDIIFDAEVKKKNLTKDKAKQIRLVMDAATPESLRRELTNLGEDVLVAYEGTLKRGDQWLETINKTYRFCGIEG